MNNILTLNWKNVLGSVVSAVIVSLLMYIGNLTDISSFSLHAVINTSVLVAAASLLKAFGTDTVTGNFAGVIPVK